MAKYTYGKNFKHPDHYGLVCYRYTNKRKSTKKLVMSATKKPVSRRPTKKRTYRKRY
jgi:hypothetical protein